MGQDSSLTPFQPLTGLYAGQQRKSGRSFLFRVI